MWALSYSFDLLPFHVDPEGYSRGILSAQTSGTNTRLRQMQQARELKRLSGSRRESIRQSCKARSAATRKVKCAGYWMTGASLTAGLPWLSFSCPACQQVGSVDLRTLDRHPGASISSLIPSLSCRRCSPNAPFAQLEMLTGEQP